MELLLFLLLRSKNGHFLQNYTTMMSCKVIEMEYENIVVTGLCVLDLVVVLENTVSVFLFWVFHGVCFHVWFCFDFLARIFKRARKNCRFFFYLIWQKKPKIPDLGSDTSAMEICEECGACSTDTAYICIIHIIVAQAARASFFLHKCGLDLSNAECHWSQNQIPHCIAEQLATHENVNGHIFFKSSNPTNT